MHCSADCHEQPLWYWKTTMSKFDIIKNQLMIEVRLTLYRLELIHRFRTFFQDNKNLSLINTCNFLHILRVKPVSPVAYPRCNANVILDQTTLRRCQCSGMICPTKNKGMKIFGLWLWWWSHQNLKKICPNELLKRINQFNWMIWMPSTETAGTQTNPAWY